MRARDHPQHVLDSFDAHVALDVTIVPAGVDRRTYTDYIRVGDKLQGDLKAPDEPGLCEIR
jgi:hypothetical protein